MEADAIAKRLLQKRSYCFIFPAVIDSRIKDLLRTKVLK
jgi:hypothetical protein